MIGVLQILSRALGAMAVALVFPAIVAWGSGSGGESFVLIAGLIAFIAGAMFFALHERPGGLSRGHSLVLAVAVWTVVPVVAAVPIFLSTGAGYMAALFEATSGFTTTGATVFTSLAEIDPAIIFWRAELQWLGGLATLWTFVLVLAPAALGGLSDRGVALVGGFAESGPSRVGQVMREIAVLYTTLTGVCIILLFVGGVPTFDAICLAFSTISTGGFMPIDGTVASYGSRLADTVVPVFMLIGASSIVWQRMVVEQRWATLAEHRETYWVVAAAVAAGILYAIRFAGWEGGPQALGEGLFTGISLVTTTGYEVHAAGLASLPPGVVLLLALAGAASLSTAGGLKFYRIGGMLVQSANELRRVIFPHSVRSARFGSQPYDLSLMKAIWANLGLSLVVIVVAALIVSPGLPDFDAAFVAAISAFSSIGPLYEADWSASPDWPSYATFGGVSQLTLAVTMVLGRLEVIVFFAAINVAYWRS